MANDNSARGSGEGAGGLAETLRRIHVLLSPRQRTRAAGLLVLTFGETILDVFGLALVPPLVYLVSDLSVIHRNATLARLYTWTGVADERHFVLLLVGAIFLTFVVRHAFGLFVMQRQHAFAYDVVLDLTRRQFKDHLSMEYEAFRRIPSSVATRDIAIAPSEFGTSVLLPCGILLTEGLVVLWILLGILVVDPRVLALMALVVLPPVLITRRLIRGRVRELGDERLATRSEGYRVLAQGLFGFTYLKLSGTADAFVERSLRSFRSLFRAETTLALLGHVPRQLVELSAVAGIGALIAYAMVFPRHDADLVTVLALLVAAAYRVMPSMTRLLTASTRIKGSFHVLDLLPRSAARDAAPAPAVEPAEFRRELAFENVSFAYDGGQGFALRDVSFAVRPGERVGFVGPSGSGKTTLMNLVLRFIREQQGRVLLDGQPLAAEHDDRRWQKLLGYVQQDPYLMDGTLAENVAFGEDPAAIDRGRVDAALRQASLGPFVASLPKGIDAEVGEFGGTLSGGQRQRIAIARALYRNASVLVLDEATSALDADTERDVIETLRNITADRQKTLLVIAHHGEMLGICDRVFELEGGRLVGERVAAATAGRGPKGA